MKNKLGKTLLMLSVMSSPFIVADVIDSNIASANNGTVSTGWVKDIRGNWIYYYNGNKVVNSWVGHYYVGADGVMLTNTWTPDGYYVDASGKWVKGAVKPEPKKEEVRNGWYKGASGSWYYYEKGSLAVNKWIGHYYVGADGVMLTNTWIPDGYYVDASGKWVKGAVKPEPKKEEVRNGWYKGTSGSWYYYEKGSLAVNKWIGHYYVGADGVMLTNTWTPDGYYVDASGKWIKGATKENYKNGYIEGKFYKNNQLANWWCDDGSDWYFFQGGIKYTGLGRDNSGYKYFANGKYANGTYEGKTYKEGIEVSTVKNGYVEGKFYKDSQLANWWCDDGSDWYFFQGGIKYTGLGRDNSGYKYFVNGKYANGTYGGKTYKEGIEVSTVKNGYVEGKFYKDNQLANWWYDDGNDWYFFKNGIKHTGSAVDNSGVKYFVNGKYANGTHAGKTYKDGVEIMAGTGTSTGNNINYKQYNGKIVADISEHNGVIDFSKLKQSVDGVIIRVGWGTEAQDKRWRQNVQGAIANGIPYGFYWYSYALNNEHANQEADLFLSLIKGYKPEYPIYVDMEDADYWKQKQGSKHAANTWSGRESIITTHINKYERAGYYGGVYASRSWFDQMSSNLSKYARWVAHWTQNPDSYKGTSYGMHQFTSTGKVNGVKGNVDLNIALEDYPTIIRRGGFNNLRIAK